MRSQDYYTKLFRSMRSLDSWSEKIGQANARLIYGAAIYKAVEAEAGVPWMLVGLIHSMEGSSKFTRGLQSGLEVDELKWKESAVEILKEHVEWPSFVPPEKLVVAILYELEKWNGWGYYKHKVNSPYLWSGSNHGEDVGKYIANGKYDPLAVSAQVGGAVLLHELMVVGRGTWSPRGDDMKAFLPIVYDPRGQFLSPIVAKFQAGLNLMSQSGMKGPRPLIVDGWAGQKTSAAVKMVTGHYLLNDNRGMRK